MEKYLAIITTVLVATQVIRLIQNTISLCHNNKLVKKQLAGLDEVTQDDLDNKREVDKMALMIAPLLMEYLSDKLSNKESGCCGHCGGHNHEE